MRELAFFAITLLKQGTYYVAGAELGYKIRAKILTY